MYILWKTILCEKDQKLVKSLITEILLVYLLLFEKYLCEFESIQANKFKLLNCRKGKETSSENIL